MVKSLSVSVCYDFDCGFLFAAQLMTGVKNISQCRTGAQQQINPQGCPMQNKILSRARTQQQNSSDQPNSKNISRTSNPLMKMAGSNASQ